MKIQVASDLHLEADLVYRRDPDTGAVRVDRGARDPLPPYGAFEPVLDRDVLVLAGDIGTGDLARAFIDRELQHSPVIYVPGNHEYYVRTWVQTMLGAPETYRLLDRDGELMAHVYNRRDTVICWAPFTWGAEVYVSHEDCGEYGFENDHQRQHHFARVGEALTGWVRQKRVPGVDLALLRDTQSHRFESSNGHRPMTLEERGFRADRDEAARTIAIAGWTAEPLGRRGCEAYRLRNEAGRMRGRVQVRYGVVRVVAASERDAVQMDRSCGGEIVLQVKLRPRALCFEDGEREDWLNVAVDMLRDA